MYKRQVVYITGFVADDEVGILFSGTCHLIDDLRFVAKDVYKRQGQNLLTFTGFTGLDPEMSSNIYRAQYPASRQFTLGIEVSF